MSFRQWKLAIRNVTGVDQNEKRDRSGSVYRPLNVAREEIRLLTVLPGTGDDIVECTFRHCRLKAKTQRYETISYVWGDASIRKTIRLDKKELDVPASSETALRRFRYSRRPRVLWIDAVCINQADNLERASQVAMMDKIYGTGSHNLIWLGEGHHSTPIALNCIHRIVEEMRDETQNFAKAREILENSRASYSTTGLNLPLIRRENEALLHFYSNEWFHRLWVLQEAALSDTSSCFVGDASCSLRSVLRAARWLRYNLHHLSRVINQSRGMINASLMFEYCDRDLGFYSRRGRYSNLLGTMSRTTEFQTSDARDHVFAVLGLLRKSSTLKPELEIPLPDYQKSVSKTFFSAAMYCIFELKDLSILIDVTHCQDEIGWPDLPSWVPNWARALDSADPHYLGVKDFDACGSQALDLQLTRDSPTLQLRVKGFCWDTVATCSAVLDKSRLGRSNIANLVPSSIRHCCNLGQSPPRDKFQLDMAMVLTGGSNHQRMRWTQSACEEAYKAYDRVVAKRIVPLLRTLTVSSTHDERLASEFAQAVYVRATNRCLFTTQSSALGLGSPTMAAGDMVVILYGCKMPAVLRKVPNRIDEYEFVGLCYIHGIMDGEAVEEHRTAGRADTVFTLV